MTHLRIENQNSNVEIVNTAIILKLYNLALGIEENLEEGESLSDYVSLKGNLLADHAKLTAYEYLTGNFPDSNNKRFPNLTINIPLGGLYLNLDSEVERVLMANNVGDGVGITSTDLSTINDVSNWFMGNTVITHFDEFGNTNDIYVGERNFKGCTNLTSIDTSKVVLFSRGAFADCSSLLSIDLSRATYLMGNYSNGGAFENCTSLTNVYAPLYTGLNDPYESRLFRGCTGITSINFPLCTRTFSDMFYGCTSLTTINMPSLTSIAQSTFNGCTALTSIDLSNVTTIGNNAFNGCTSLTSIDLSNVTSIGNSAFIGCTGLTGTIDLSSLTLVSGDTNKGPFLGCTGITSVTNLNKANAYYMFYGCTGLTSVGLTLNCTNIGYAAFTGCSNLSSVSDLSNVTKIDDWGFSNCRNLSLNVSLLLNLQQIGSYAFAYDSLVIGDLNLPNITGSIGLGTFYNTSITKILSLGHIQSISAAGSNAESRAFGGCTSLTEVDLSTTTSLTSIGTASFVGCSALTLVKLPSSITSIGGWAFAGSQLMIQARTYCVYATTPPTLNARHSIGTEGSNVVLPHAIYVPEGSVSAYKNASVWSNFASVIYGLTRYDIFNGTLSAVPDEYFKNDTTITSADFTNANIISVGESAFEGCTGLTSINLNNCTTVSTAAFKGCTGLTTAVIGKLSSLSGDAFDWGQGMFANCTSLTTLDCGDALLTIVFDTNSGAFSGTENLLTLIIRNTTPPTLNMDRALGLTLAEKLLSLGGPNVKIYVPDASVYRADTNWAIFSDYLYNISALPSS